MSFSCNKKNNIVDKAKLGALNPIDIPLINIGNPVDKYTYDWNDTNIVSIDHENGKWVGIIIGNNVNKYEKNDGMVAIEFFLENKIVEKNNLTESFVGSKPILKIKNDIAYIYFDEYVENKKILKSIDLNSKDILNEYQLKIAEDNMFAIDDEGRFYISQTPGVIISKKDKIKNKKSGNFYYSPKDFPITKYNQNMEKQFGFGRWLMTDSVISFDNVHEDIFLSQRFILHKDDYIYTYSFKYGYLEKYNTDGEFLDYLDVNSKVEFLYNKNYITHDMEMVGDNLYVLSAFISIENFPILDKNSENIGRYIWLIKKFDLANNEMTLENIYYIFPEKDKGYTGSFEMIDEKTAVFSRIGGLDVFKLK